MFQPPSKLVSFEGQQPSRHYRARAKKHKSAKALSPAPLGNRTYDLALRAKLPFLFFINFIESCNEYLRS